MVRDSKQSVAMPWTTQPSGQALSGERQQAVSGNALDHSAMGGRPSVVRVSKQAVVMPWTTRLLGQALSVESCVNW